MNTNADREREERMRKILIRSEHAKLPKIEAAGSCFTFGVAWGNRIEAKAARLAALLCGRTMAPLERAHWARLEGAGCAVASPPKPPPNPAPRPAPPAAPWTPRHKRRSPKQGERPGAELKLGLVVVGLAAPWEVESMADDAGEALLVERGAIISGAPLPLYVDHDRMRVAGEVVELLPCEAGLRFRAELWEGPAALDAARIIGEGGGASCDYAIHRERPERFGGFSVRRILQASIHEISITTAPRFAETLGTLRLVG